MKHIASGLLTGLLLYFSPALHAQEKLSLGGIVGMTSYYGDFNSRYPICSPSYMVGGVLRYAYSDYYSLRVNMTGGTLRGNTSSINGQLMSQNLGQQPANFSTFFFSADARIEVGFMPYDAYSVNSRFKFSPYYTVGLGMLYASGSPTLQVPMGFGVKYRLAYRFTVGAEWMFCKTFTDDIDGWENVSNASGSINNKDWLTYIGIHITYQIADRILCPSYK
ncbi:MAG: DUF6089 family protein [Prevotellaceae bacterium]|jgi:hypothetical protein|nr:DUF6089 family protein [Prevotellaceae bacterium]